MIWDYWIALYLQTYCTARGLRASSIDAYQMFSGVKSDFSWEL